MSYPELIENLIRQLSSLPGVGRRSAERMVFWFLNNPREKTLELSSTLLDLKEKLKFCKICNNLTEQEVCRICGDPGRDETTICVVENPKDLFAIERSGAYKGMYHVLLGAISPQDGRGPEDIKLEQLISRLKQVKVREVIIATDPDTEGEMTAIYISNELRRLGIRITRIGLGLPVGSAVEYVDISTLSMSMLSRREIFSEGKTN